MFSHFLQLDTLGPWEPALKSKTTILKERGSISHLSRGKQTENYHQLLSHGEQWKKPGLFRVYISDSTIQLYMYIVIMRIPIEQPGFHEKKEMFFFS